MFKFYYSKEYIFYNTKTNRFEKSKNTLSVSEQRDTEQYILSSNILSSYKDFVEAIRKEHNIPIKKSFYIFKNQDIFTIFRERYRSIGADLDYLFSYKPESKKVEMELDAIFQLNNNCRFVSANSDNYFSLILPPEIYGVLLSNADIISREEQVFDKYKLKSKSGKVRDIIAPHPDIKIYLQQLNRLLQNTYDHVNDDFQVAYKKGKNIVTNASIHKDKPFVLNIDLKDFYPSCKRDLVEPLIDFLFKGFTFNYTTKNRFLDIILENDGLFIGSPISGCLANMVISKPVAYMKNMCKKFGVDFSVYADDMTFSSDRFLTKEFVMGVFKRAFDEYSLSSYFILNPKKFKGGSKTRRHVTGVSFDEENRTTVHRSLYREIRAKIHSLSVTGSGVNIPKLRGQIAFGLMLEEGTKIKTYLNKYTETVEQFKLCAKEKYAEG